MYSYFSIFATDELDALISVLTKELEHDKSTDTKEKKITSSTKKKQSIKKAKFHKKSPARDNAALEEHKIKHVKTGKCHGSKRAAQGTVPLKLMTSQFKDIATHKQEKDPVNILWCMGSKFCVKFQRCPLKFHTKVWAYTPQKNMDFMKC